MQPRWGIYVHIPYCKSLCPYCDFNAHLHPTPPWEALQSALLNELAARAALFAGTPSQTLYFGGGTPSLAPASLIEAVVDAVRRGPGLAPDAEITLEANPGTVDEPHFHALKRAGVNRISLGWQSTHDRLLRVLGRGHSASASHEAYHAARAAGFTNISLDLIFAVPGQTEQHLAADLTQVIALRPEHVSLYALTYKEGTPFHRHRARGTLTPAPEELELAMMAQIEAALTRAGYTHYEISNYALPGRRAQHNTLYWQGARYLALGPGAHGFHHEAWQRGWRWENTRAPQAYLNAWLPPEPRSRDAHAALPTPTDGTTEFIEPLTSEQLFAERMLCGLRLGEGIPLNDPALAPHTQALHQGTAQALTRGWATLEANTLIPTAQGHQHADALAALFF